MADELFDARNALTVGNFHQAIADASSAKTSLRKPDDIALFSQEKEALLTRAQIGLGQCEAVIGQLRSATVASLVAVRLWAEFILATRAGSHVEDKSSSPAWVALEKMANAAQEVQNDAIHYAIVAVAAYIHMQDYSGALTLAKKWLQELPTAQGAYAVRQRIELHALVVEAFLRLRRPDLAYSEVKAMEKLDDEALLTLMYTGVVALHRGESSCSSELFEQALRSFKEVSMRCGQSVMVLNLTALAHMALKDYEAAERSCLDALAIRSEDAVTLGNLATISSHLGKSTESTERSIRQACTTQGAWLYTYSKTSAALDEAVDAFLKAN